MKSTANALVRDSIPPLEAQYAGLLGNPRVPPILEIFIIEDGLKGLILVS